MKKGKVSKHAKFSFYVSIAVIIFMVMAFATGLFEIVRLKAIDALYFLVRPQMATSDKIAIVTIDDMSIKEFGVFPWPRRFHARLVDFMRDAGARAVGFDALFSDNSPNQSDDKLLIDATKKAGNIYHAVYFSPQRRMRAQTKKVSIVVTTEKEREMDDLLCNFCLQGKDASGSKDADEGEVTIPIPSLTAVAKGLGNINYEPDQDGAIRNAKMVVSYKGRYYPSLSLCLIAGYKGVDLKDIKVSKPLKIADLNIPINSSGELMVNYVGPFNKFRAYPYYRVVTGEIPKEAFKDKIVLVGSTATGAHDLRVSPFSGNFPGVGVHANVINSIIENKYLVPLPNQAGILLIIIFGLMMGYVLPNLKPLYTGLFAGGICLGLYLTGLLLFMNGFYMDIVYPIGTIIFSYLPISLYGFMAETHRRREITAAFGKYVSPAVVEELLNDPQKLTLGGVRKKITVLYADIRDFTPLSEGMEPEEVVSLLNELFEDMTEAIFKYEGTLDKFIGDAILALFGTPVAHSDDPQRAVKAAWEMRRLIELLNEKRKAEGNMLVKMGIGINTGEVVVGNIGSHRRMDYTVIGDGVNTTQRVEDQARKGEIYITASTYELVKDIVDVEKLEPVKVKGKENLIQIYEVKNVKL